MTNGDGDNVLQKYWQFLSLLVVVSGAWFVQEYRVDALAEELSEVKEKADTAQNQDVNERLKVRSLEERQESIQDDVEEIKEEQKEQSKKLDKILEKLNESD